MKLVIITPTFRRNPGFGLMAQSIAAQAATRPNIEIEWLVCDEALWYEQRSDARRKELADALRAANAPTVSLRHVAPKPSAWRGPGARQSLPDSNGVRNSALAYADGDYVAFLDDCTVLGQYWLATLEKMARGGHAARYWYKPVSSLRVKNGIPQVPSQSTEIYPCEPGAMKGNTGGYPIDIIEDVGGFDEQYAGSYGFVEVELAVRASRIGCSFRASRALEVFEMPHDREPQSFDQGIMNGSINQPKFGALLKDRSRTQPVGPQHTLDELRAFIGRDGDLSQAVAGADIRYDATSGGGRDADAGGRVLDRSGGHDIPVSAVDVSVGNHEAGGSSDGVDEFGDKLIAALRAGAALPELPG